MKKIRLGFGVKGVEGLPVGILISFFVSFFVFSLLAVFVPNWIAKIIFIVFAILSIVVDWKLFFAFLCQIPYDPPTVGVLVIKGQRQEKIMAEGWYLMLPWWDIYTARLVNVQKKSLDIDLKDVRTKISDDVVTGQVTQKPKAGGEVSIKISLTWAPSKDDEKEILAYLNSGRELRPNP